MALNLDVADVIILLLAETAISCIDCDAIFSRLNPSPIELIMCRIMTLR